MVAPQSKLSSKHASFENGRLRQGPLSTMEEFPEDSPFYGRFRISSHAPLRALTNRYTCQGCQKSTRYFCYRCVQPAPELVGLLPEVQLPPVQLVLVKHVRELEGKSTAVHVALLAPSATVLVPYDPAVGLETCPVLQDVDECAVLFPEEGISQPIASVNWSHNSVVSTTNDGMQKGIKKIVVIDGTWQQAKGMLFHDPLLKRIKVMH